MKKILLLLFVAVPIVSFSQKISCEETLQLYVTALEDFQTSPLIIHKKDKEVLVTKPWTCDTVFPSKVGNTKVKWISFDDDLSKILKGDIRRHNGRSAILISHRQPTSDSVTVHVHQKILGDLGTGMSFAPINETIHPAYKKKNHDFLFVKIDSKWMLEAKSNDLNPITPRQQEIEDIFQKGNALYREGNYKEALEHVERSMRMDSSAYQRYLFKARIKVKLGMFESANSDVTKCIERCDCTTREFHVPYYYIRRAEIHILNKNYNNALKDIDKSISLNSKDWRAYFLRARLAILLEEYKIALENLNKSIELNEDEPYSYQYRGFVYTKLGDLTAACSDYKASISMGLEEPVNWVDENCK